MDLKFTELESYTLTDNIVVTMIMKCSKSSTFKNLLKQITKFSRPHSVHKNCPSAGKLDTFFEAFKK